MRQSVVTFVRSLLEEGKTQAEIISLGKEKGLDGRAVANALTAEGHPVTFSDPNVLAPYSAERSAFSTEAGIPLDPNHAVRPYSS